MSRKNSQENDWDRFDESILSVTTGSGRRRTESGGPSPSPGSAHSDRQPHLVTSQPSQSLSIPVINQRVWTREQQTHRPLSTLSAPEVRLPIPKSETSDKDDSSTDCNFCNVPLEVSKAHDPHTEAMFSCAACGEQRTSYEEISKHVQDSHVGDDMELVLASIIIPSSVKMLKEFKCGIKSCGRRFIGRDEKDLLDHISNTHGPYYIKICKGRNLVRLCRICSGIFESDAALTDHILQWHPAAMFANDNEESCEALEAGQPPPPHSQDPSFNVVMREDTEEEPEKRGHFKRIKTSVPHMDLEKLSRKRKISESIKDRLTLTTDHLKRSKTDILIEETPQDPIDRGDLKHKLKKIREAKDQSSNVFCEACYRSTNDWPNHKYCLEHIKNDKKARCHFCPKRFWIDETRRHMARHHRGSSFTCNKCGIKLISLDKMTEHINAKHRDEVKQLIVRFGQYWESDYVSANHLGMNNFFLIPSDLRRLSCRVCGRFFLGQDQTALEQHFRLEHSQLARSQYTEHIRFECRVCSGVLFGSEAHLLKHFKEVHSEARLSIEMESEYTDSEADLKKVHVHKRNFESQDKKVDKASKNDTKVKDEKKAEIESDSSCYVERVTKKYPKLKRRKLLNTFKSSSFMNVKSLYSDHMSQASISTEDTSDSENAVVACNFCETKMRRHQLDNHLKNVHKENLFSCDGSCGHKVYTPWKHSLMSHLRTVHKLRSSDSRLCQKYMNLPAELTIISCKAENCSDEAIFLARDVATVRKMLTRHAEKRHRGIGIDECFNLGCRVCTYVWGLGDAKEWTDHCQAHHGITDKHHLQTVAETRQETQEISKTNLIVSKSRSTGTKRQLSGKSSSDVNSNDPKALSLYLGSKVSDILAIFFTNLILRNSCV